MVVFRWDLLEKGLSLDFSFIAIAPMLGFMGTVIGMIQAFDRIEAVGDLSPSVVAGGIKVALLTTVFGLIAAIILQIFYNYIVSKIDGIVNKNGRCFYRIGRYHGCKQRFQEIRANPLKI
jgi:biopolymer transport protein ExbB